MNYYKNLLNRFHEYFTKYSDWNCIKAQFKNKMRYEKFKCILPNVNVKLILNIFKIQYVGVLE